MIEEIIYYSKEERESLNNTNQVGEAVMLILILTLLAGVFMKKI